MSACSLSYLLAMLKANELSAMADGIYADAVESEGDAEAAAQWRERATNAQFCADEYRDILKSRMTS